jgi:transcriptional regulator with XRE-family HTH domain
MASNFKWRYPVDKVKELRKKKGLRQIDLAKRANVSLTWLWVLENGFHERVSNKIKKRIADILDSSIDELFLNGNR